MSRKRRSTNKLVSRKFKLRLKMELLTGKAPEVQASKQELMKDVKKIVGKGNTFLSYLREGDKGEIIDLYNERVEEKRKETADKILSDRKLNRERMEKQEGRRKQGIEKKRQAA